MYVIYTIFVFYINIHIYDNIYTHIYKHIDTREMVLRRMLCILPCFAFCAISTHIRLRILPFVHTYVSCMFAHFVAHDTCCAFLHIYVCEKRCCCGATCDAKCEKSETCGSTCEAKCEMGDDV